MSMNLTPESPKHGYEFDGYEHDVRRARRPRPCEGGRSSRSAMWPEHAEDCTGEIATGDVYVATILELFRSETAACVPCALDVGAIRPAP